MSRSWRSRRVRGGTPVSTQQDTGPAGERAVPDQDGRTVHPRHRGAGARAQEVPLRAGPDGLRRRRHHRHRHLRPHRARSPRRTAGPATALAFVAAGIVCALAALCYAEFASTVPVAGSAYTFSYASLGELPAWIIGWDLVLEFALGTAVVAVGWSGLRPLADGQRRLAPARRARRARRGGRLRLRPPGLPAGAGADRRSWCSA